MKAISTKYLGPTDRRGSRIIASDGDHNRLTIGYPHELNSEAAHRKAAEALRDKMGWKGHLFQGSLKHADVFVFDDTGVVDALAALVRDFDKSVWTAEPMLIDARAALAKVGIVL